MWGWRRSSLERSSSEPELEAIGSAEPFASEMAELEKRISEHPWGMHVSWDHLARFAGHIHQVVNGVFCGSQAGSVLRPVRPMQCEICLEALFLSMGRWAKDDKVLSRLEQLTFR